MALVYSLSSISNKRTDRPSILISFSFLCCAENRGHFCETFGRVASGSVLHLMVAFCSVASTDPTEPFPSLESQNPWIVELYGVKKRQSKDFEASIWERVGRSVGSGFGLVT